MIITFFGHADFQGSKTLEQDMLHLLEQKIGDQSALFYFGGYGAFDRFAYRCGKMYKSIHPSTKLILITPYPYINQSDDGYDETVYPPLEQVPQRLAIVYRNQWMVRQADLIVVFVNHAWGAHIGLYIMRANDPRSYVILRRALEYSKAFNKRLSPHFDKNLSNNRTNFVKTLDERGE